MPRQTLTPPHSAPSHNPAPHCHSAPCAHPAPDTHPAPDAPAQHPASLTVLTVRPASGLSGDMLLSGLAALLDLDAPALDALTDELRLPALHGVLRLEARQVNGIAGVGCHIDLPHEHSHRSLADILALLDAAALAREAFTVLAAAEGAVHGKSPEQVTFHEVGALDSILDICLACRLSAQKNLRNVAQKHLSLPHKLHLFRRLNINIHFTPPFPSVLVSMAGVWESIQAFGQ